MTALDKLIEAVEAGISLCVTVMAIYFSADPVMPHPSGPVNNKTRAT